MKSTFLQIDIQQEFAQLVKNSTHYLNVIFALIFGVNEDFIKIHNDKNIEFFCDDLIDVALECC